MVSKVQATENGFYGDNPQNKENKNCLFVGCWGGGKGGFDKKRRENKKDALFTFCVQKVQKN